MQAAAQQLSEAQEAPRDWRGVLRHIGPGIVVTGSVIGSGELINLPQRAASYGFVLLWAVILSCVIKYWLQIEIGRYCLTRNLTTVQALNTLPGPKWRGTHIIPLLYLCGFLLSMATLAGILTATAGLLANVSVTKNLIKSHQASTWTILSNCRPQFRSSSDEQVRLLHRKLPHEGDPSPSPGALATPVKFVSEVCRVTVAVSPFSVFRLSKPALNLLCRRVLI